MRHHHLALLSLVAAFSAGNVVAVHQEEKVALRGGDSNDSQQERQTKELAKRRVIVSYKSGHKSDCLRTIANADSVARNSGQAATEVNYDFEELDAMVITADPDVISQMENAAEIESIEDDVERFPTGNHGILDSSRKLLQDRPYGLDLVQAPEAWALGFRGQGAKVCVIDSGIDRNHPGFESSAIAGSDTGDVWSEDGCGHGTHVAGTIAGTEVGVAPDAEIFVVRVFGDDCGIAYSSGIYNAAKVCAENGANIVSMSLGGPLYNFFEANGFKKLYDDDVLLIAAAGNGGNNWRSYPASYNSVMSVAALDDQREHAPFSQYNNQVDVAAPGVDVESTFPVNGCRICDGKSEFGSISGTSMATPHVSGVAALLKSAKPTASFAEIREAMQNSARDLGDNGKDKKYGYGLVQAKTAIEYLTGSNFDNNGDGVTDGGNNGNTGGGNSDCTDKENWYDSDGPDYDCDWYSQGTNCNDYGDGFANDGATANVACCGCGGGNGSDSVGDASPATPPPTPGCEDQPGWVDSDGDGCDFYAKKTNCAEYGDDFSNEGYTANTACCICQS